MVGSRSPRMAPMPMTPTFAESSARERQREHVSQRVSACQRARQSVITLLFRRAGFRISVRTVSCFVCWIEGVGVRDLVKGSEVWRGVAEFGGGEDGGSV